MDKLLTGIHKRFHCFYVEEKITCRTINIPGINFQACTGMILAKESIKKLKTFSKFPNAGQLNEIFQAMRFI